MKGKKLCFFLLTTDVCRICPSGNIKRYEVQGGNLGYNLPLSKIESQTFVGLGGRNLTQRISVRMFLKYLKDAISDLFELSVGWLFGRLWLVCMLVDRLVCPSEYNLKGGKFLWSTCLHYYFS